MKKIITLILILLPLVAIAQKGNTITVAKFFDKYCEYPNYSSIEITEDMFAQNMWTAQTPDPDVVVRTGSAQRLSNFLLFQAAYSELYFLDRMWPEVTEQDLESVYTDFELRRRRFGK